MSNKVRLSKQSNNISWEQRIAPYVPYLLIVCLIILILLIFALVFTVMGVSANTLTGNEGNAYYYHMKDVI